MSDNKSRIFIKKIEIKDCGRYYGSHELILIDPKEKNITIIYGNSGTGKSTLHDLIYWCLYGEFKKRDKKDDDSDEDKKDYGLINIDKLEDLEVGEEITASVTLSIHDEKGEKYFLTRSLTAKHVKDNNKRDFHPLNNSFVRKGTEFKIESKMMSRTDSGKKEPTNDSLLIKTRINNLFPQNLSDFFLFDGENLEKFRKKSTSSGYIKKGIEKISGLGVLDRVIESSTDTSGKISNYVNGKSATTSGLNSTYNTHKKAVDELEEKNKKDQEKYKEMSKLHEQFVIRLNQLKDGKKVISDLSIENQLKNNSDKELSEIKNNIQVLMFKHIPNLLAKRTFQDCEALFEKLEDEDKIPPAISRKAIDKILNSDPLLCVCGRSITKNDEYWKKLMSIRAGIINENASKAIGDGADLIGRMIDSSQKDQISEEYGKLVKESNEKIKLIEIQVGKISLLDEKVRQVETDEGEDLGIKKSELWQEMENLNDEIKNDAFSLEGMIEKRDRTKIDLDKKRIAEGKYKLENNKISILNAVAKFGALQRKEIVDLLREQTQYSTNRYFMETAPEKQSFDHVEISPKYEIFVRDERKFDAPLSKGQGHVLGLSYVAGCRDVTHVESFLIIDSPFHNISGKARNEMSKALAEYLPGIQLILLVTDTEYTQGSDTEKSVRDILKDTNQIWKEYKIQQKTLDKTNKLGKKIECRVFEEL